MFFGLIFGILKLKLNNINIIIFTDNEVHGICVQKLFFAYRVLIGVCFGITVLIN